MITVRDLIKSLKKLDPDKPIVVWENGIIYPVKISSDDSRYYSIYPLKR